MSTYKPNIGVYALSFTKKAAQMRKEPISNDAFKVPYNNETTTESVGALRTSLSP